MNDADCTLLAGNTVFKVHRFLLARDGSTFENMFALPTNGTTSPQQGRSDDDPIVLYDDEEEFRALCWVLYALPTDIVKQTAASGVDILRLLRIILMSNKYNFSSYESWATSVLADYCLNNGSRYLETCQPDILSYTLNIAVVCDFEALRIAVQNAWIRRIQTDGLPVVDALQAGEDHGLRDFQGMAYYNQLQIMNSSKLQPEEGGTAMLYTDPTNSLTTMHKLRLYAGYWSLSKYWELFSTRPAPSLPRTQQCQTLALNDECSRTWSTFWRNSLSKVSSTVAEHTAVVDVVEKLELLQKEIESPSASANHFSYSYFGTICSHCRGLAKGYVAQNREDLRRTLGDHFLGPVQR